MSDLDLASLATRDEALTERVTALMWRMVEEAEDILDRGSPRDRVRLLSANLPALTRALKTDDASQMADVRNAITALMVDVRGSLLPDRDVHAE